MSAPLARRGFLRGLTTLPLVGGGVALIGDPSGVLAAPSQACCESYLAFLHYEFRAVHEHLWPGHGKQYGRHVPVGNPGADFHFTSPDIMAAWPSVCREAAHRAPVILSAVGCGWEGRP